MRPLDKEGKQHCFALAYVLNALKVSFDEVISSPLKRSLQTAQLVATETGYERKVLLSDALAPEAKFEQFRLLLEQHQAVENLLVVGHSPTIQEFLGCVLLGREANDARVQIRLRKGSIARVSLGRGPAVLQNVLDPRTVRALSRTAQATSTKSSRRKTSRK